MKALILMLLASLPVWGHEAYFVYLREGSTVYLADVRRLDACRWQLNRTGRLASLYFRDPVSGRQLVATFPHAGGPGQVRHLAPQRPGRRHHVTCKVSADSRFLSLAFTGQGIEGEVWLDLQWANHGR